LEWENLIYASLNVKTQMMNTLKQTSFTDFLVINEPDGPWDEMSEEERIDFIREHGTDTMIDGLEAVLQGNKYKPKREDMWENRLHKGKRMVKTIIHKKSAEE